ncbi:MAG: hypothetical protein AAB225_17400 [Acidobacteriota bacterium]
MSSYISSNANRWYVGLEQSYGRIPAITSGNRIPAVKLTARQQVDRAERRDKTGSRTFPGLPSGLRKRTSFELKTYLTAWGSQSGEPGYGPLFRASLGGGPLFFNGGAAGTGSTATTLKFATAHGLAAGQAVTSGGELRFAAAIVDATTVVLNAPLSAAPPPGAPIGPTMCYQPALELPSVSILDYWTPGSAVQRILCGAAVDTLRIRVNADFHEFEFSGAARDLIDSSSFTSGQGELVSFPAEPALGDFDYSVIPGHLGQVWLGSVPERFYTLTSAELEVENQIDLRNREFGSEHPRSFTAGMRVVTLDLGMYEQDDAATQALYQAARQRSPVSVMFQLGQTEGQLFGVYLKSFAPEVPEFDDTEARLEWRFASCRAQGTLDDEIYVAFG